MGALESWALSYDVQGITWALGGAGSWDAVASKDRLESAAARFADVYRVLGAPEMVLAWMLGDVDMSARLCADLRKARALWRHTAAGLSLRSAEKLVRNSPD